MRLEVARFSGHCIPIAYRQGRHRSVVEKLRINDPAQGAVFRRVVLGVVYVGARNIALVEVVIVVTVGKKVMHILCQQGQKKHSQ